MIENPRVFAPKNLEKENPCHGCTERQVGCHCSCERHAKWKKAIRDAKDAQFDQIKGSKLAFVVTIKSREGTIRKMSKRTRKKFKH